MLIRIVEEPTEGTMDIHGINIVDFPEYKDGTSPDKIIIEKYKTLMINIKKKYKNPIVASHCIASLGRSMCFIALEIYWCKIYKDNCDIITYIRTIRPGSFNTAQLHWFIKYKEKRKNWFFLFD